MSGMQEGKSGESPALSRNGNGEQDPPKSEYLPQLLLVVNLRVTRKASVMRAMTHGQPPPSGRAGPTPYTTSTADDAAPLPRPIQPKGEKSLMQYFTHWLTVLALLVMVVPAAAQQAPIAEGNPQECVTDYDPDTDYFPAKAQVTQAEGFSIAYFDNYKVIDVTLPWSGATEADSFQYVLVQCGTPAPDGYEDAQMIEVPTGDLIAMSTTYLPQLVELELTENLIGLDSFLYTNTPEIVALAEDGEVIEVGSGGSVNVEMVLAAEPDMVMTYGSGIPDYDAHPALLDAGIFVAINGDFAEPSLLGRAEWMKFLAAFYNEERAAEAAYADILAEYEAVRELAADIPAEERLTVLYNAPYQGTWFVPGQATWAGELLTDAGVDYVLMDDAQTDSVPLDFEAVYAAGLDAPVWIPNLFAVDTIQDLVAQDERYADFAAVQQGGVWNTNGRVNANGGNDFYETGVTNPHLVLRDLVAIFYPDVLPEHDPMFFLQLPDETE